MLTDDEMWDDPQNDPPEPYWDRHEDNYGRITRRPQMTEYERLEALADMGIDTWDDYEGNK